MCLLDSTVGVLGPAICALGPSVSVLGPNSVSGISIWVLGPSDCVLGPSTCAVVGCPKQLSQIQSLYCSFTMYYKVKFHKNGSVSFY